MLNAAYRISKINKTKIQMRWWNRGTKETEFEKTKWNKYVNIEVAENMKI